MRTCGCGFNPSRGPCRRLQLPRSALRLLPLPETPRAFGSINGRTFSAVRKRPPSPLRLFAAYWSGSGWGLAARVQLGSNRSVRFSRETGDRPEPLTRPLPARGGERRISHHFERGAARAWAYDANLVAAGFNPSRGPPPSSTPRSALRLLPPRSCAEHHNCRTRRRKRPPFLSPASLRERSGEGCGDWPHVFN